MAIKWVDSAYQRIPVGLVSVRSPDKRGRPSEIIFPHATAQAWGLGAFKSVRIGVEDKPGSKYVAALFSANGVGDRPLHRRAGQYVVHVTDILRKLNVPCGRYLAKRDRDQQSLVWIELAKSLTAEEMRAYQVRRLAGKGGDHDDDQ